MSLYLHPLTQGSPAIDLALASIQIGRAPDNNVILTDPTVSRHHALIQWQGKRLILADLNSTGGTFVDDVRIVQPSAIRPGDTIKVGRQVWQVMDGEGETMVTSPPPANYSSGSEITVAQPVPAARLRPRVAGVLGRAIFGSVAILVILSAALCIVAGIVSDNTRANAANANATLMALALTPGNLKPVGPQYLALVANNNDAGDIYRVELDHPGWTKLTSHAPGEIVIQALMSPDGSQIAFTLQREFDSELYVTDRNGNDTRQLTYSPADENFLSWSPDGSRLVFSAGTLQDWTRGDLYLINLHDNSLTQLTNSGTAWGPAWSPDGDHLAYMCGGNLCQMRSDGSERGLLIQNTQGDSPPAWSPDGQRILYVCGSELCVIRANGADRATLPGPSGRKFLPTWLPDGRIAFYASANSQAKMFLMNEDGTNLTNP